MSIAKLSIKRELIHFRRSPGKTSEAQPWHQRRSPAIASLYNDLFVLFAARAE